MQVVNFGGASPVEKIFDFAAHSTTVNCVALGPVGGQVLATGGRLPIRAMVHIIDVCSIDFCFFLR